MRYDTIELNERYVLTYIHTYVSIIICLDLVADTSIDTTILQIVFHDECSCCKYVCMRIRVVLT